MSKAYLLLTVLPPEVGSAPFPDGREVFEPSLQPFDKATLLLDQSHLLADMVCDLLHLTAFLCELSGLMSVTAGAHVLLQSGDVNI